MSDDIDWRSRLTATAAPYLRRVDSLGPGAWAAAIGALALLLRLPFVFQTHRARPGHDDEIYLRMSDTLLRDFRVETDYYTPGYPAFEAVMRAVPGRVEPAVVVTQHLIGVAMVVAIVLIGWRWFGRAPALIAGVLAAITPMLVVQEHTMLPDFLFGTLACAGAVALAAGLRRDPPAVLPLVVAGVLLGAAAWVKPAGVLLFMAGPLAAVLAGRGLRAALRPAAIVTLALVVTISPWLVRNAVRRDYVGMSRQGGQTLFNRVFERDMLDIPRDHEWAPYAEEVRARIASVPDLRFHKEFRDGLERERGVSYERSIAIEGEMARIAIRRQPLDYAEGTWREFRGAVDHLDTFDRREELQTDLDSRAPGAVEGAVHETWSLARTLLDVWWLLSLHAVAGLLLLFAGPRERRVASRALFAVWLCVVLGSALAHGGLWRYSMQVAPIAWLLGSAGLVIIVSAVRDRLRATSPPGR